MDDTAQKIEYERWRSRLDNGPSERSRLVRLLGQIREAERSLERAERAGAEAPSDVDRRRAESRIDRRTIHLAHLYELLDAYPADVQLAYVNYR